MNLDYKNHKHFSFDLWATLIKSNPKYKIKRVELFRNFFEIDYPINKIKEVVRYYDIFSNTINEKTGLNIDTFEIYFLILDKLKVNLNSINLEKLNVFYLKSEDLLMQYKPDLIYPKIDLLFKDIVNQDKTINILSNNGFIKGSSMRKLMQFYDLEKYFSFQIYSDETGFSKPNPRIFNSVFEQINLVKPIFKNEILHIGDNPIADYNGAILFGFDALLIKNQ